MLVVLSMPPANAATDEQSRESAPNTQTLDHEASDPAELAEQVLNDPDMEYVTVAEAIAQYGYDPNASFEAPAVDEPSITPLWSWGGCDYVGKADYPHVSSNQASVHGYWLKTGGTCPSTALVTVDLQALACTSLVCAWVTQNTAAGTYVSGSGTGKWATPHKTCANTRLVAWRGQVDVDLTDWADPYGYDYSAEIDLNCSPA